MQVTLNYTQYTRLIGEAYCINPDLVMSILDKVPRHKNTSDIWFGHEWFLQLAVDHAYIRYVAHDINMSQQRVTQMRNRWCRHFKRYIDYHPQIAEQLGFDTIEIKLH